MVTLGNGCGRSASRLVNPAARVTFAADGEGDMRIGVPKEIKVLENRVGLTPGSVREAVHHGHQVIVEHNAGQGIGMDDEAYRRAGAAVVGSAAEVFASADMIVKVKDP